MDDELDIKIGEEITEDLPLEEPRLQPGQFQLLGGAEEDAVRIILHQTAYSSVNEHARSAPDQEVGGILVGQAVRHEGVIYVEIEGALKAPHTQAGAAHLTFTPDSWSAMNREQEQTFPGRRIVGWYHTHPRMDVFFSGDDVFLHKNFFSEPWQVALVLEPHKHFGRFYYWRDGSITPANSFYEHFDVAKKSIITWRNVPVALATTPAPNRATPVVMQTIHRRPPVSEWFLLGALVLLALLTVGTSILTLQTGQSVRDTQSQVVGVASTVGLVSHRLATIESSLAGSTAVVTAVPAFTSVTSSATAEQPTTLTFTPTPTMLRPSQTSTAEVAGPGNSLGLGTPSPTSASLVPGATSSSTPTLPSRVSASPTVTSSPQATPVSTSSGATGTPTPLADGQRTPSPTEPPGTVIPATSTPGGS